MKLITRIALSSLLFSLSGFYKTQSMFDQWQAIVNSRAPETVAEKEAAKDVGTLLKAHNHPDPNSVTVLFIDKPGVSSCYSPFKNTIYLTKTADRFTRAHEASHATHDSSLWPLAVGFLSYDIGMQKLQSYVKNAPKIKQPFYKAIAKRMITTTVFSRMALPIGFFLKFVSQPRELRADINGAQALIKLGDTKTVEDHLKKVNKNAENWCSKFKHTDIALQKNSVDKALLYVAKRYSGFHFDRSNKQLAVDYKRGSSETFWNNWGTHPREGTRYFAIEKELKEHKNRIRR